MLLARIKIHANGFCTVTYTDIRFGGKKRDWYQINIWQIFLAGSVSLILSPVRITKTSPSHPKTVFQLKCLHFVLVYCTWKTCECTVFIHYLCEIHFVYPLMLTAHGVLAHFCCSLLISGSGRELKEETEMNTKPPVQGM